MNTDLLSSLLTALGDIIIGYAVIRVHSKMGEEHRIDRKVIKTIQQEKWVALSGIFLVIAGFVVKWLF